MEVVTSAKLFEKASECIPGGVNSPVRAWKAVGGTPRFFRRGRGCRVFDVDGNEYIDYVGSWGPLILGHAHQAVVRKLQETAAEGTSFGAPTPGEVDMALRLVNALPGMDMVRLVNSGTEATMTAIRVARAFTGRQKIIKFVGCYHGHSDGLLVRAGSGALTFGVPNSAGVGSETAAHTLLSEFNDLDGVRKCFADNPGAIAGVIVEPVVGNMGVVLPRPGFLEGLREITKKEGALLIFDEVMTGFRVAYGGVQTLAGIEPDMTCLGKVIGGGLPLAAVGGRRDVMEQLAPCGPAYQAGTLAGNPLAVAAGLATLEQLAKSGSYERLEELGAELEKGLSDLLKSLGIRGCVNRKGSMWTLFFGVEEVRDFRTASACDVGKFASFFHGMLEEGIYLPPSAFEAAFISLAHTETEIAQTVAAAEHVLANVCREKQ